MDKALILFGAIIIFFGMLVFYLLFTSVINLGKTLAGQYSSLPELQQNQINIFTPVSAAIVLIGVMIVREGFKR